MRVSIEVIRNRAELARRIAHQLHNGPARKDLLQIADDLEAEAAKLETVQSNVTPIKPQ
jgi:molecular chaperone GrpE (heat shock protein)